MPRHLVSEAARSDLVAQVEVLPQFRSIEVGVYAVCLTRKHVSPKVRVLFEFLSRRFGRSRGPSEGCADSDRIGCSK
jgi:DNA-binding transcriptional LysR family regulator